MMEFRYIIDAEDRIVSLSDNWLSFAVENGAGVSCHPDQVINRPIWEFIHDLETEHLYQVIIGAVRSKKKSVTLPFRCDAPDRRRYLELRIALVGQDQIEFVSHIMREETRDCVELLQPDNPRSVKFIKMCSMCRKVKMSEEDWVEVEEAIAVLGLFENILLPQISHGCCPECFTLMMVELEGF